MLRRTLALVFFIFYLSVYVSVADNEFSHCDDEGFWSVQNILETQKICDFFIAIAYFSIPVELLYFISFSNVPFKWVLVQFIAFIVLCGLTHLLNGWTYNVHHSFQLMLALTIAKFSTAFVSCATAITLLTLIPLILKIKVREVFLTKNVLELNQEVGMMKRQKEVSWHVRMLTRKIRKSLDKHTILYTTLVELSKTLGLHNCAVWMPNENRTQMILTHELKKGPSRNYHRAISFEDPDVLDIKGNKGVTILRAESALSIATCSESGVSGTVAAIRLPMLRVSNFKGGTPQLVDTSFAILVLVPTSTNSGSWTCHEMEIVEVVADQVAVALSHADVLEESQVMRKKLSEQNVALQQAKKNAIMACKAWASFQKVMSPGMRRPMHSILGLISMFQEENLNLEQNIIIDTMAKISSVISTLINDAMISTKDNERFSLEVRPFDLHSMIREAACLVKCMSVYEGFTYEIEVHKSLPNQVIGDEKRAFQVILHMVGYLLSIYNGNGKIIFRISPENNIEDDKFLGFWTPSIPDGFVFVNFEFETEKQQCFSMDGSISNTHMIVRRHNNEIKENLSFRMCKKIVQMMQGNIWISPNAVGFAQSMTLVLRFQIRPSIPRAFLIPGISLDHSNPNPHFRELRVLLADDDFVNRTVIKKLLEKLGCQVTAVSSGFECLNAIQTDKKYFRIVVLDLHMPEMDGFELAMRIRNSCIHNLPLIIAVTASAENNVWERCLQIGMNGLIRKPVLLQGMADELQRVMQWAGEGL